jgi:HEAT repeat protein
MLAIDGVRSAPTMVIFDDGNTILKQLTYDQPTAQLAEQLRRDPNLWNRAWVVRELAKRTSDSTAAHALADAAVRADYYLTRIAAADGIAAFPGAVAIPVLSAALRDTSALVRTDAASALGEVKDSTAAALALARQAWSADSSYAVRAAALSVVAKLDPADRASVIRSGLTTASYQDAIQNAALGAAARYPDAVPPSELEASLGTLSNTVWVWAAMARGGNAEAMRLLLRHLDEDRGWVRAWVVGAFRNGMPDELARAQLQPVRDKLTHADTRAAVDELLKVSPPKP